MQHGIGERCAVIISKERCNSPLAWRAGTLEVSFGAGGTCSLRLEGDEFACKWARVEPPPDDPTTAARVLARCLPNCVLPRDSGPRVGVLFTMEARQSVEEKARPVAFEMLGAFSEEEADGAAASHVLLTVDVGGRQISLAQGTPHHASPSADRDIGTRNVSLGELRLSLV